MVAMVAIIIYIGGHFFSLPSLQRVLPYSLIYIYIYIYNYAMFLYTQLYYKHHITNLYNGYI